MAEPNDAAPTPRNRLLAALSPDALARLWPRLRLVAPPIRDELMMPGEPIEAVYFPETGWISMLALLSDGQSAEVGLVGNEGMTGLALLLGGDSGMVGAMVQGTGTLLRLEASEFRRSLEDIPGLREVLLRFALAFQDQVTQTAMCNGNHALDQRLARWLLRAHDRVEGDEFPITHESLALMLCVHRPGVTIAARLFQQAGLIRYGQGRMTILDRPGLEAAACECYAAVQRRYELLLGSREELRHAPAPATAPSPFRL